MRNIVLANGHFACAFDPTQQIADMSFPLLGQEQQALGRLSHVGLESHGVCNWLDDENWDISSRLGAKAGQAHTHWQLRGSEIRLSCDDTLYAERVLARRITIANTAPVDAKAKPLEGRLLLHHNFALAESDIGNCVRYLQSHQAIVHYKRRRYVLLAISREYAEGDAQGIKRWTFGRSDADEPRAKASSGSLDCNPVAIGATESLIAEDFALGGGASQTLTLWVIAGESLAEVETLLAKAHAQELQACPKAYAPSSQLAADVAACGLSDAAQELTRVSPAFCAVHVGDNGAIIAAHDTNMISDARQTYAYVWPRDGALVADTLSRLGRASLATAFFAYSARVMESEGYFLQRYNPDESPAGTWHADFPQDDPHLPIQEDETALVLWALCRHLKRHPDSRSQLGEVYAAMIRPMAAFLERFRCAEKGLPRPSHDLWEERYGVHTFTCAAVRGSLVEAADFALEYDEQAEATAWSKAAQEIESGMKKFMFHEELGRFARMAQVESDAHFHLDTTPDASLAGLFMFGEMATIQAEVKATMNAVETALTLRGPVGGIARYLGDHYQRQARNDPEIPGNPWIITTMWMASWHARMGSLERAEAYIEWAAKHASPSSSLPEQLHPSRSEPISLQPLGWSHAEFINAVLDFMAARNGRSDIQS